MTPANNTEHETGASTCARVTKDEDCKQGTQLTQITSNQTRKREKGLLTKSHETGKTH